MKNSKEYIQKNPAVKFLRWGYIFYFIFFLILGIEGAYKDRNLIEVQATVIGTNSETCYIEYTYNDAIYEAEEKFDDAKSGDAVTILIDPKNPSESPKTPYSKSDYLVMAAFSLYPLKVFGAWLLKKICEGYTTKQNKLTLKAIKIRAFLSFAWRLFMFLAIITLGDLIITDAVRVAMTPLFLFAIPPFIGVLIDLIRGIPAFKILIGKFSVSVKKCTAVDHVNSGKKYMHHVQFGMFGKTYISKTFQFEIKKDDICLLVFVNGSNEIHYLFPNAEYENLQDLKSRLSDKSYKTQITKPFIRKKAVKSITLSAFFTIILSALIAVYGYGIVRNISNTFACVFMSALLAIHALLLFFAIRNIATMHKILKEKYTIQLRSCVSKKTVSGSEGVSDSTHLNFGDFEIMCSGYVGEKFYMVMISKRKTPVMYFRKDDYELEGIKTNILAAKQN